MLKYVYHMRVHCAHEIRKICIFITAEALVVATQHRAGLHTLTHAHTLIIERVDERDRKGVYFYIKWQCLNLSTRLEHLIIPVTLAVDDQRARARAFATAPRTGHISQVCNIYDAPHTHTHTIACIITTILIVKKNEFTNFHHARAHPKTHRVCMFSWRSNHRHRRRISAAIRQTKH